MHKTLKKLYRDHAHFNKLLKILDQQLDALQVGSPLAPDLLKELVRYSHEYSDGIHHPVEDQLYTMLLARSDAGSDVMEQLLVQHLQITNMTMGLRRVMEQDSGVFMEEIIRLGKEYAQLQREHMELEEKEAFTLLRQSLADKDFDVAAGAIPTDQDPLEDTNMHERYPALFAHLAG